MCLYLTKKAGRLLRMDTCRLHPPLTQTVKGSFKSPFLVDAATTQQQGSWKGDRVATAGRRSAEQNAKGELAVGTRELRNQRDELHENAHNVDVHTQFHTIQLARWVSRVKSEASVASSSRLTLETSFGQRSSCHPMMWHLCRASWD